MKSYPCKISVKVFLATAFLAASAVHAQTSPVAFMDAPAVSSSATALPDAPSTALLLAAAPVSGDALPIFYEQDPYNPKTRPPGPHIAPLFTKYIPAGWTPQHITARDKVIIGLRDSYAPLTLLGDVTSAAYSDVTNGEPNYGTNGRAIGKRIGATVLRDGSEGLLTDTVFAPLLHEDPRYFVEGPQYNFFHRAIYAATRPIITRTDSGRSSINGAMILGDAAGSAISYTYYPQINKNFKDTASTFGGSLGGDAVGFLVSEFADQFLQALHLEKRD